jgi:hypothetical protein
MKKKLVMVLVILGVAAAIGYLMGTEGGRARRDDALARRRKAGSDPETELEPAGDG